MVVSKFDKKTFSELLIKAMGDRKMSEYAHHAGISLTYLSELIREQRDNQPMPPTIKKLADKAYNGVTYEELMAAAGHLPETGRKPPLPEALEGDGDNAILIWFKSLPPDVQLFLKNKDSQPWIELAKDLKERGFSFEAMAELIASLINTMNDTIRRYNWTGQSLLVVAEEKDGKYTAKEKGDIAKRLEKKTKNPNFKPPWTK
ncbi:MAG: hypothetical protein ACOY4I_01205 [Bacillota bacterium]